ncbi:Protein PHYTOCHROME KINASE SUBSTRATE 1 [Cardamine amara subsp. amara]|uniref:Protein PHYTOCHROME KINASE SUBSTRATE 1 n=1 Tax=Cardamine amara subsp. amara TaxID=228776 RepID=A0ABD0ZVD8_CARAN
MVTLTSSSSTPKTSFDFMKNNNTRTPYLPFSSPSSSSYLIIKEDAVVTTKKLMEPIKTLTVSINPKEEELGDEKKIVKKASEDPEIGVFGAEKYFNGDMDSDKSSSVLSLTNPELERIVDDLKQNAKKSTGTPSVRSESSWNSQSVLLQNKVVNSCNSSLHERKNNSGQIQKVSNNKKSFLANLGCKCACSDGNSVEVDEKISVKRSSDPNISVFTARKIENQMTSSENMNTELIKIQKQEELAQRKSLEVFGSPVNVEKKRIVVQKKLPLPRPWESRTDEEDTKSEASDTSADLFEIESFKPKPLLTRQGSDPASPTCYAPSEVSVEWSIVTASAADFSVMSDCATSPIRKNRSSQIPRIPNTAKPALQRRKSSSSVGSGLLMGCKSYKSVRVSGDSDRKSTMNKTQPNYVPRFPMETTKPKSFETRRRISNSSISHTQSSLLYQ